MKARDDGPDVLDELRAELRAVEPSAGFAGRVRARVAASPAGRVGRVSVALAAVAVVATVGSAYWTRATERVEFGAARTVTQTAALAPAASAPVAATTKPPRPRRVEAVPASPDEAVQVVASGPDMEIVTNQPEILRRMWARPAVAAISGAPTGEWPPIGDVVVAPVVVTEITVADVGAIQPVSKIKDPEPVRSTR